MFEDLVKEGEDAALQCSDVSGFEGKPEVAGTDQAVVHDPQLGHRVPLASRLFNPRIHTLRMVNF